MTSTPSKKEARGLKVAEYRSRALDATAAAEACGLSRVKEAHERAAAVWTSLAEAAERRVSARSSGGAPTSADRP